MKQKEFELLSQEIRDVLRYNQDRVQKLTDEIRQMELEPDHTLEADEILFEQMSFLKERGISVDVDAVRASASLPEEEKSAPSQELSWEEIVKNARSEGYKDVKIEDILTEEEIRRSNEEFKKITDEFGEKTRLTKVDIAFLGTAVLLQVIRQYFITPLTEHVETKTAAEAEKEFADKYNKGGKLGNKYYRASMDTILHYKTVPYDVIRGSKDANIAGEGKGIGGTTHRYYTLGHDPALYVIFGTSNILTNTMSIYDGRTFHIKYTMDRAGRNYPTIVEEANTPKMLRFTLDRLQESAKIQAKIVKQLKKGKFPDKKEREDLLDSFAPTAAFVKAKAHLKSDESVNGLPAFFSQLLSPEFAMELSEYGFDAAGVQQLFKDAGKQAAYSFLINQVIAILHGFICKAENQEDLKFVQVRTRKVLLISNLIATSSNIVINAVNIIVSAYTGNPEGAEFARKYMDIGGALITLTRVFSDLRFIGNVWSEFVLGKLNNEMVRILDEIEFLESDILGDAANTV